MEPPRVRCALVLDDGTSRRVGIGGLSIGRARDCDLVLRDPSISRRHALVRVTSEGAEIVPLGRAPIEVNGKPTTAAQLLADGDTLRMPDLAARVEISLAAPSTERGGFVLERADGASFGIAHSPFVIGSGPTDDLVIKRWPANALALHVAQSELFVEVREGSAARNGEPLELGALEPLEVGDRLAYDGETFTIAHASRVATTVVGASGELPTRVAIEMLPRGGRIAFTIGGRERAVYLADRRFDLMVALLRPPSGYQAGELVPDDTVRTIVWPRKPGVSRQEINMLISRCRRDLLDAGIAGPRLVERAPGGGATRFRLAPGAEVVVES